MPAQPELTEELTRLQEELANRAGIIKEQKRKTQELYKEIQDLQVTLADIYASEGWKLLGVYYRFRNRLLPRDSSRHRQIRQFVNWLRRKPADDGAVPFSGGHNRYLRTVPTRFDPFRFPHFARPKVSIIVPAYNGWEMNYLCLRSIWEHTGEVSYEVIFADDVSTDETQHVELYVGNIVHIRNDENLGFLRNCNHAASVAKGQYLHFLNNDTEVTPGWLSSLVELMEKDVSIGLAGSKLIYPDGRLQEAGGIIWQDASGWNYGHHQDPSLPAFNYVKEVDYISGASLMVRKSVWEALSGFDDRYQPAYFEDTDLAFAVREAGYKVVYQPLSEVIHFEGFSHGTDTAAAAPHPADAAKPATAPPPAGAPPKATAPPPAGAPPKAAAPAPTIKSYQRINATKFAEKWASTLQHQFPNGVHPFLARDRSQQKPTILVIDHYVPRFDEDAGSRSTFLYLELFVELGMNVKFIGDNFYRSEPYTTALQQKGIEVLYGAHYKKHWLDWLKEQEPYIDYVFLNRPHISIKYIHPIRESLHAKIFYFTHDLHFYRELMEYQVTGNPQTLASSETWKKTEYELFSEADVVLTPSYKEQETIRLDFPTKPVEVMPLFFYPSIAEPIRNFAQRKDILFAGGFSHKPNVDAVLWMVGEVMPLIPGIRLIVVGSNVPEDIAVLASPDVLIKGYVTDEALEDLYDSVRLSVIPLRFGAGLKGKTVEPLARALPIVSTSFGIEGMSGIEAVTGAYDTAAAFAGAVKELYGDTGGLEAFSVRASDYARQHFTKTAAAVFFKKLFVLR